MWGILKRIVPKPKPPPIPVCGEFVRYQPWGEKAAFLLPADFVAEVLSTRTRGLHTASMAGAHQQILDWIKQRDRTKHDAVDVPAQWLGRLSVADNTELKRLLTGSGVGSVVCDECGQTYPVSDLVEQKQPAHGGWNFAVRCCPRGHRLISVETIHISRRS